MHIHKPLVHHLIIAVILLLLSLVAIQPFLQGRMLLTDDGTLHLYRTIVLDHSLRFDGALYPRYSSALAYGYGAPLFNYFSPIAYLLPRTLHLFGMSFIHAWLASMVAYLWLAMWGAFLLGKVWTNAIGGIVCAVSYLYAPYMLYDAISRGTITEVAALGMLPLVLWALTLLARQPSWWSFGLATLLYAIFIPLHNIITLHGSLLISAYCLLLISKSNTKRITLLHLLGVGFFGLLLTTFFWLPALGETQYVKINQVTDNLPSLDVTRHLRPLSEILALPTPVDPRQQQAPIPITVSWLALIAGGMAVALSLRSNRQLFGVILFWWTVVMLMLFMNTEASTWLWKNIPFLKYTQFAWRTLVIASLGLAMLTGIGLVLLLTRIPSKTYQNAILGFFVVMSISYSFSFTYRPFLSINADSVQDTQDYEHDRGEIALSSYSEYLPITNSAPLDANKLAERWAQSDVISRFDDLDGLEIVSESWGGTAGEFVYQSEAKSTIVLDWLWMPGFAATLDDLPLQIKPSQDFGLVELALPMGEHVVRVWFQGTTLQQLASIASFSALLVFVISLLIWKHLESKHVFSISAERLPLATIWTLATTAILCVVIKNFWVDNTSNIFHQTQWEEDTSTPTANFNNQLSLIASTTPIVSNQHPYSLLFSTYWELVDKPIQQHLIAKYILRNRQGITVAESDSYQIAGLDTTRWLPDLYLEDKVVIQIPDYTPPGEYTLYVSIFDVTTLAPLPTINSSGNQDVPIIFLSNIILNKLTYSTQDTVKVQDRLAIQEIQGLPTFVITGDTLTLMLIYAIGADPKVNDYVQILWDNNQGKSLSSVLRVCEGVDTTTWLEGEQWRCYIETYVPAVLANGRYSVTLLLLEEEKTAFTLPLGEIQVSNPVHLFVEPLVDTFANVKWSNGIKLVGYKIEKDSLVFVWQTSKLIDVSLHMFVHLVDENGILLAQSDSIPSNWTRPTTGWIPEEYIVTEYEFIDLARERIHLEVGFYDPTSFERIALEDGQDLARIIP